MSIRAVCFDFDGVFPPNSDAVHKSRAYAVALRAFPQHEEALAEAKEIYGYGKKGGRKEILAWVARRMGGTEEEIPALVETASREFDEYVQKKILEDGLTPGAIEMLEELACRSVALYLNSGTATSALVTSARNLGISGFFKEILGSTPEPIGGSKVENLCRITHQERLEPSQVLMVGDGDADLKAADESSCPFLGFANKWNGWADTEQAFRVAVDLRDVPKFL